MDRCEASLANFVVCIRYFQSPLLTRLFQTNGPYGAEGKAAIAEASDDVITTTGEVDRRITDGDGVEDKVPDGGKPKPQRP